MEEKKFDLVYCLGTEDGKGVREALEAHGGKHVPSKDCSYKGATNAYYISPRDGTIDGICIYPYNAFVEFIKPLFTEIEPLDGRRRRAYMGGRFWVVRMNPLAIIDSSIDAYQRIDNVIFESGNYFLSEAEAQEYADKINQLFKDRL